MKLHTNIKQTNIGLIKSKPAWQLEYRLELTTEEAELVRTYRMEEMRLGKYLTEDGKTQVYMDIGRTIVGGPGPIYTNLNEINAVKVTLVEGCVALRDQLRQIQEIRAGGSAEIIDFPLHEPKVRPAPVGPPPVPAPSAPPVTA